MVGDRCTKTANQHIARLRPVRAHLIKSVRFKVIQIEVLAFIPPVFLAAKIRQINTGQMVGITEKCVAVVHAMLKLTASKVRHAAEFMNFIVADQPPRKRRL